MKNGTLGTITEIAGEGEGARLTVRLDRVEQATGTAAVVSFELAEYAHIDHGYAATVHKAQSVTVDRAHVLATPGMDRHLAYVAMTRHRHGLALHWSEEDVGSREGLIARLGRERAKDTTLDYGESDAELCAAYAERRGLQPVASAMPPHADLFDGLHLGVGLPSSPIAMPRVAQLADAVAAFLVASRDGQKMVAAGLPLLAHHEAALRAAQEKIEGLRPGFTDDLVAASQRQPLLVTEADPSAEGVAPLIAAGERIWVDREETARRQAEYEALAPVRDRLLKERMEAWWRKNYPHNPPGDRSAVLREMARPAEAALKREIAALPADELRRVEAAWRQAELNTSKPSAMPSSAPRRSGPSPF